MCVYMSHVREVYVMGYDSHTKQSRVKMQFLIVHLLYDARVTGCVFLSTL